MTGNHFGLPRCLNCDFARANHIRLDVVTRAFGIILRNFSDSIDWKFVPQFISSLGFRPSFPEGE